ncbi:MAG: immunity 70 family protein [Eggerthellaceae bacterium]|nr:immunity 70 family protein [Eggerthellaceae bacterium]
MSVGLQTKYYWYTVGTGDFLHSFFSTIAVNLEGGEWGSRFPCLMKELYSGEIAPQRIVEAKAELSQIKKELEKLPPSEVVWDIERLDAKPPWGDSVSDSIADLSNYFVASEGEDLFEVFDAALSMAEEIGEPVKIVSL